MARIGFKKGKYNTIDTATNKYSALVNSTVPKLEKVIDEKPVLLLDDVMSELDSKRQNDLLSSLDDMQILLSCTGVDEFIKNRFHIDKIFEIKDNSAIEMNGSILEDI